MIEKTMVFINLAIFIALTRLLYLKHKDDKRTREQVTKMYNEWKQSESMQRDNLQCQITYLDALLESMEKDGE